MQAPVVTISPDGPWPSRESWVMVLTSVLAATPSAQAPFREIKTLGVPSGACGL